MFETEGPEKINVIGVHVTSWLTTAGAGWLLFIVFVR